MPREPEADGPRAENLYILAPTWLEWCALRAVIRRQHAKWCGLRLERWHAAPSGSIVILCGLAGALRPGLSPGSIFIPDAVTTPDGPVKPCDPNLVEVLRRSCCRLGYTSHSGNLLTSPHIVTGSARERWSAQGYDAADMETGLLPSNELRVATVRVILDTPDYPLAEEWEQPLALLRRPRIAGELWWLAVNAPRFAARAARVVNAAMPELEAGP